MRKWSLSCSGRGGLLPLSFLLLLVQTSSPVQSAPALPLHTFPLTFAEPERRKGENKTKHLSGLPPPTPACLAGSEKNPFWKGKEPLLKGTDINTPHPPPSTLQEVAPTPSGSGMLLMTPSKGGGEGRGLWKAPESSAQDPRRTTPDKAGAKLTRRAAAFLRGGGGMEKGASPPKPPLG